MDTKRKYSVTVIPDKEGEPFTPSSCTCKVCVSMNDAQLEWDTFIPETNLQRRMKKVVSKMLIDEGDDLPVSLIPNDGTFPVQTTCWERRNVSLDVPEWIPEKCVQCGRCSLVCPHGVIRVKKVDQNSLNQAPSSFKSINSLRIRSLYLASPYGARPISLYSPEFTLKPV